MSAIWYIGDLHFGHEKVANLRGFATPYSMNSEIMYKWEEQVKEEDVVYVMGDISGGSTANEKFALGILSVLPGRKRLIKGNHDSVSGIHRAMSPNAQLFNEVFETQSDYGRIRVERENILLSHYPYWSQGDGPGRGEGRHRQYRLSDFGELLIHAHTHHDHPTNGSRTGRELCVSWDAWGRMVGQADITAWLADIHNGRVDVRLPKAQPDGWVIAPDNFDWRGQPA